MSSGSSDLLGHSIQSVYIKIKENWKKTKQKKKTTKLTKKKKTPHNPIANKDHMYVQFVPSFCTSTDKTDTNTADMINIAIGTISLLLITEINK